MKLKKFLLTISAISPLSAVAISCSNNLEQENERLNEIIKSQNEMISQKTNEILTLEKRLEYKIKENAVNEELLKGAPNIASNLWNSFSGNKDITSKQAYENAKRIFDQLVKQDMFDTSLVNTSGEKVVLDAKQDKYIPVVFMDLDETVLNNFRIQNYFITNGGFDFNKFEEFVDQAISDELLGSIDFIKHVWKNGGVVMFNSNRRQSHSLIGSRKNLVKLGLEEKYTPDWVFWMKGVDIKAKEPWKNLGKSFSKEERMNAVNSKSWIIDGIQVKFKTVMRIGDDINDFNDNFSKYNDLSVVKEEIKNGQFGKMFGNSSLENKSIYFNPQSKKWENKDWAESYIFISGNATYGGWIRHLKFKDANSYSAQEGYSKLQEYAWSPKQEEKVS